MKVIHVNFSGSGGGAAIAALRISTALNEKPEISSTLWCSRRPAIKGCQVIFNPLQRKTNGLKNKMLSRVFQRTEFSLNLFSSSLLKKINASDADVINLHWVNAELISLKQLGLIQKPVVWTFHDMWAFCGGEHYSSDNRYIRGYTKNSYDQATDVGKGFTAGRDLNRWIFNQKRRYWGNFKPHIICPSQWLVDCASNSMMFAGGTPFHVVPNCIDLHQFSPREDKEKLKEKYGIPSDRKIILFGAVDPHSNRKGGDLLLNALMELKNPEHYAIAVFGTSSGGDIAGIKTIRLGPVFDPERIAEIYNCADVMCVPSRQDNLPNTCVEAHACGLPIVAFNIGGIPDIVNDRKTGYLADAFDSQAFAAGIRWVLGKDKMDYHELSDAARSRAVELFDGTAVANKYIEIYKKSMEQF